MSDLYCKNNTVKIVVVEEIKFCANHHVWVFFRNPGLPAQAPQYRLTKDFLPPERYNDWKVQNIFLPEWVIKHLVPVPRWATVYSSYNWLPATHPGIYFI